jgi:hypothetical protein
MAVYEVDPLTDPRWRELLERKALASVFHTPEWLEALKHTYGYEPIAYTTSRPTADLENGWLFCRVHSWLTGNRLVSLPFSDHCDPLVEQTEHFEELLAMLQREREERRWKYVEWRPLSAQHGMGGLESSQTFRLHKLDLRRELPELFRGLHKDSTQRKIRRADREHLTYEEGNSKTLLNKFYPLLVATRLRHRLPPQPIDWFCNLAKRMGDQLTIQVALRHNAPVASILTLRFKRTLTYKYGCADEKSFPLGGMQMLLWRAIEDAKSKSLEEFDLGRSDADHQGLILFKDRLGATSTSLSYYRCPAASKGGSSSRSFRYASAVMSHIPDQLLAAGGKLYKHLG